VNPEITAHENQLHGVELVNLRIPVIWRNKKLASIWEWERSEVRKSHSLRYLIQYHQNSTKRFVFGNAPALSEFFSCLFFLLYS
jgi:hypothetical protein